MNNFSDLNHLPANVKVLIVNGQTLINEANETMKEHTYKFDLTSKREIKTDIKTVERNIFLIAKGKATEKNIKALENSIIKLRTVLTGVVNFFVS